MSDILEKSELRKIAEVGFLDSMEKDAAAAKGVFEGIKGVGKAIKANFSEFKKGLKGKKPNQSGPGLVTKAQGDAMKAQDKVINKGLKTRKHLKANKKKYIAGGAAGAGAAGYAAGSSSD